MRRLMAGVMFVGAIAAQPAWAQKQCASSEKAVFEVQALRSELMVLATGCRNDDQYNAFIRRYQAALQANEKEVDSYFKKKFGRRAQTEHDRFVTELANALSSQGTKLGSDFCPRNGMVFSEVMALSGPAELADFAAGKDLVPATMDLCTEAEAPVVAKKAPVKATPKRG